MFSPTSFVGEIQINEESYKTFEPVRDDDLFELFNKKISGTRQFPIFLNKNKEVLDIFWSDEKFDKLYFVLIEKNIRYLAPASNSIEAKEILKEINSKILKGR
ncbi:hypothetical protein [Paenibacillus pinihumi]|uniref:hypothetical protein n=1 Tax=Paenibacillus pinihumi TaxID=669462 RepID=UPI00048B9805|nr:hypothetical protein [Paenibacillus pinihumi]